MKYEAESGGLLFLVFLALVGTEQGRQFAIIGAIIIVVMGAIWLGFRLRKGQSRRIRLRRHPKVYRIEDLRRMDPYDVEELVGDMLKDAGFTKVKVSGGAGDLQADLTAISPNGKQTVVQVKRYAETNPVGSPDIQTFVGVIYRYHRACAGMFVTTSRFTKPAREYGESEGIVLVDGDGIIRGLYDEAKAGGLL